MNYTIAVEKSETRTRLTKICLLEYARTNRKEGYFNDVAVTIDNDVILANRMVLSYCCLFFEKMFKAGLKESHENAVKLQGVEAKAVEMLIEYFYTGTIEINNQTVIELLSAADYLQLDEVKGFCSQFLQSVITSETCVVIFTVAKIYRLESLERDTFQFIKDNFAAVKDKCCLLSKFDFIFCISKLDRSPSEETLLYQAIVTWVKHNEEERRKEFPDLLKLINFKSLPSEFLADVVSTEDLVTGNLDCSNLVMNRTVQLFKQKAFKCKKATKIISFGGSKSPSKVIDVYNSFDEHLMQYPDLPKGNIYHVIGGKLNHCVYSIGTSYDSTWSGVCCLDANSCNWKTVDEPVGFCQAAIYNDSLIAITFDHSKKTSKLSCYFSELVAWEDGPQLQQSRSSCELITCDSSLYVVGGKLENNYLSSVERLSVLRYEKCKSTYSCSKDCLTDEEKVKLWFPLCGDCRYRRQQQQGYKPTWPAYYSSNKKTEFIIPKVQVTGDWKTVQNMQIPRSEFAATSCNERIYAIGGQSNIRNVNATNTVEQYDPTTNAWTYVSEMNHARRGHAACVVDGKIYVVGGKDDDGAAVNEIECFDPSCDTWTVVGSTADELCGHSLIAL